MKRFKVTATVHYECSRIVEAIDETDALDQCRGIGGAEWREGSTVEDAWVHLDGAAASDAGEKT